MIQRTKPIVTVVHPELTAEEREERMRAIEQAFKDFVIALRKQEAKREAANDIQRLQRERLSSGCQRCIADEHAQADAGL